MHCCLILRVNFYNTRAQLKKKSEDTEAISVLFDKEISFYKHIRKHHNKIKEKILRHSKLPIHLFNNRKSSKKKLIYIYNNFNYTITL